MEYVIKVAVVDDNIDIVKSISQHLKRNNEVIVDIFTDSTRALQEIIKGKHDIVITDNAMPIMDGIVLAEKILSVYKPHIIMISGILEIPLANMFDFTLSKPINWNELTFVVNRLIRSINNRKDKAIEYIINELLIDIHATGKDKIVLEEILKSLLYDYDSPMKGSVYDLLSEKQNKDPRTISRNISRAIDRTYEPSLFERILGFTKKPKNKEMIDKMLEVIHKKMND